MRGSSGDVGDGCFDIERVIYWPDIILFPVQ